MRTNKKAKATKTSTTEDIFHKLSVAWAKADEECRRTFSIWDDACQRRRRLVVQKNEAWKEVQAKRRNVAR